MSKYKDVLIVPLYRNMYNPKGGARVQAHHYKGTEDGDGVLLVVILPLWQQFLVGYPHNDEYKPKEMSMIRKEFQLVLWSWISIPVWYQIYATGKGVIM